MSLLPKLSVGAALMGAVVDAASLLEVSARGRKTFTLNKGTTDKTLRLKKRIIKKIQKRISTGTKWIKTEQNTAVGNVPGTFSSGKQLKDQSPESTTGDQSRGHESVKESRDQPLERERGDQSLGHQSVKQGAESALETLKQKLRKHRLVIHMTGGIGGGTPHTPAQAIEHWKTKMNSHLSMLSMSALREDSNMNVFPSPGGCGAVFDAGGGNMYVHLMARADLQFPNPGSGRFGRAISKLVDLGLRKNQIPDYDFEKDHNDPGNLVVAKALMIYTHMAIHGMIPGSIPWQIIIDAMIPGSIPGIDVKFADEYGGSSTFSNGKADSASVFSALDEVGSDAAKQDHWSEAVVSGDLCSLEAFICFEDRLHKAWDVASLAKDAMNQFKDSCPQKNLVFAKAPSANKLDKLEIVRPAS